MYSGILALKQKLPENGKGKEEQVFVLDEETKTVVETAISRLVKMSPEDVMKLAQTSGADLIATLKSAAEQDPSLSPELPANLDGNRAALIALSWKLKATEEALDTRPELVVDDPTPQRNLSNPSIDNNPRPQPSLLDSLAHCTLQNTADVAHPTAKRHKVLTIGGVPIQKPDKADLTELLGENPLGFRPRLGTNSGTMPSQLGEYPGRATGLPMLRVSEILGPSILLGLVQEVVNVELAVRNRDWKRGANGEVLGAEAEALTLTRCIHFNLLQHPTMTAAIEECLWMEIALRRLFAILYVENTVLRGQGSVSRAAAWHIAKRVLEVHPATSIRVPCLDSPLAKEAASSIKESNALRNLGSKSGPSRGPVGKKQDRNKGSGRPDQAQQSN